MKISIFLRSGGQIEADVDEFTINKNLLSGRITEFQWSTPAGAGFHRLKYLDVNEIVAIVSFHDPDDLDLADEPVDNAEETSPQG